MRRAVLFAALAICACVHAMPLGLRTAMLGTAPASRRAAVESVFPVLGGGATAGDVAAILGEATDPALAENISSADDYADFREWAKYADPAAVKASGTAWLSYAFGAVALFENEPTVEIGDVSVATDEDSGEGSRHTTMTVSVAVKDGERAVTVNREKVAAMFEATGDLGDWNGAALVPRVQSLGKSGDAMRFTVTPGDGTAAKAFLRIRK